MAGMAETLIIRAAKPANLRDCFINFSSTRPRQAAEKRANPEFCSFA